MNVNAALAIAVLALHLLWILWVIVGCLFTRGRKLLTVFHVLSLIWGIAVEAGPWPCPLTYAEQWFENQAGVTAYQGSFIVHYLEAMVYPDVSAVLLTWCGVAVCVLNLGFYGWRFWIYFRARRSAGLPRTE